MDDILMRGMDKMREIIEADAPEFYQVNGEGVYRIVGAKEKVSAFNAIVNMGKYLEERKLREAEGPDELDFTNFQLIDGQESQRHRLHQPATQAT